MFAKHQFKYTYEGSEDFSPIDITFDVPGDATLQQMLNNFHYYLKACGFVFDGELQIVDETFDVMKDQDDIDDEWDKICKESEDKAEQKLKEWSEGLAKLEAEIKAKREGELKKNNWVHGICNPKAN